MTPAARKAANERSFTAAPRSIGGYVMREVSAGSLTLCRAHGITFVDRFDVLGEVDEEEGQRQTFTFLFIHGCPDVDHMLAVMDGDAETRTRELVRFGLPIPVEEVMSFLYEWHLEVQTRTLASLVKVQARQPKAPPDPKDAPPPNS